jgi:hypothetical protein
MNAPAHRRAAAEAAHEPERRERRPVAMLGFLALEDGTTAEASLLDLSYEGCGIATMLPLAAGQPVTLSVPGRGAIEADVRWSSGGKAGLVFRSDLAAEQTPRSAERIEVTAEVTLRRLGNISFRVRLFDLSPNGCKVELVERPREGEHMMVKFEGLEALDAQVCWVEKFIAGLSFEKSFHPAVFDLLLQRLR